MILLETEHGFISDRYIIKLVKNDQESGWWVYYQMGEETTSARCGNAEAGEFMEAIKRLGR
jgi:hypothetical protein